MAFGGFSISGLLPSSPLVDTFLTFLQSTGTSPTLGFSVTAEFDHLFDYDTMSSGKVLTLQRDMMRSRDVVCTGEMTFQL